MTTHALSGFPQHSRICMEFQPLVADSGWNSKALQGVFLNGLSDQIKDEFAAKDDPVGLDPLISLAT